MPKDRLPAVVEFHIRLYPCGPCAFDCYQYMALIKTDPDQPDLNGDDITELFRGMGYAWEINDINVDVSPDWTRVEGLIRDPSKERFDSSSDSSDDSNPSDYGDSREEQEHYKRVEAWLRSETNGDCGQY